MKFQDRTIKMISRVLFQFCKIWWFSSNPIKSSTHSMKLIHIFINAHSSNLNRFLIEKYNRIAARHYSLHNDNRFLFRIYFFLACKKQYKIPACAITSTVLVSSWSFCLGAFRAGRSKVGPNTIAKLWRDILFSFSCWWALFIQKKSHN